MRGNAAAPWLAAHEGAMRKPGIIVLMLVGIIGVPLVFWAVSFIDSAPAQNNCPLKSVSHDEYLRLMAQAKAQDWTVWPGLSKGIFWPSDGWLASPPSDQSFEHSIGERLLQSIEALSFDHNSAEAQLAAAHAVMRSMHAEFVSTLKAGACKGCYPPEPARVWFTYFIPQRRFAPLCLPCLVWWYTTIRVFFSDELNKGRYSLEQIVVLNADLKYDPQKEQERNAACPELPTRRPS
jgi:hypothetical protein